MRDRTAALRLAALLLLCLTACGGAGGQTVQTVVVVTVDGPTDEGISVRATAVLAGVPAKRMEVFTQHLQLFSLELPGGARGLLDLTVVALLGEELVAERRETVDINGPGRYDLTVSLLTVPFLSAVEPSAADRVGGQEVIVRGRRFEPNVDVRFAGMPVSSIIRAGSNELRVRVPTYGGPAGGVEVTVINPDGPRASRSDVFSYR